jgi:hypothetical protein
LAREAVECKTVGFGAWVFKACVFKTWECGMVIAPGGWPCAVHRRRLNYRPEIFF